MEHVNAANETANNLTARLVELFNSLGIEKETQIKLANLYKPYKRSEEVLQRTFENRFEDHLMLLWAILSYPVIGEPLGIQLLRLQFLANCVRNCFFVDIGPGLGNDDPIIKQGKGKPAITTQEIAKAFPQLLTVVALDLPAAVEKFTGSASGRGSIINPNERNQLLGLGVHIVAGDGLTSILDQWKDSHTNPYRDRARPTITGSTPVIIRIANSLDIYCEPQLVWQSIERLTKDFEENPVLLFYNRWIFLKRANERHLVEVGLISNMGFNHVNRILDRMGKAPFNFSPKFAA